MGQTWPRIAQFTSFYKFCVGLKLKGVAKSIQCEAGAPPRHTLNEALMSIQIIMYLRASQRLASFPGSQGIRAWCQPNNECAPITNARCSVTTNQRSNDE